MKVRPVKPHFFKPILPGFMNGLKIPVGFLKYLKRHEHIEHATLRRDGKKWLVKLFDYRFEAGWSDFAEHHDLQLGDMLVFRHEGNMEFEVVIFDSSHCNREYAEYLQEEEEEANNVKFKDKPKPCILSSSKDFPNAEAAIHNSFSQSQFVYTVKPYALSNSYFRIPTQFAFANGLTNKSCGVIIRDERQRSWNLRLTTYGSQVYLGGRWREFHDANDLKVGDHMMFEVVTNGVKPIWKFHRTTDIRKKPSNMIPLNGQVSTPTSGDNDLPYFTSTIKPYSISKPVLYLPLDFAKSNGLMNRKCEMILKDEAQRSWSVRLGPLADRRHFGIARGWAKFRAANGLQVGDAYKFELIKNGKIPVAHFHHIRKKPSNMIPLNAQVSTPTCGDNDLPYFTSTIKHYCISNPVLYLPLDFAKSNGLMNRNCEMILKDEAQRSWSVRLGPLADRRHFGIVRGWAKFRAANGLQVGDAYKFELIKNGKIPIAHFHCKYSGKVAKGEEH